MPEISTAPGTDMLLRQEVIDVFDSHEQYVIAQVQFGQAALKCRGTGICRVDLYINDKTQWGKARCSHAIGKMALTESGLILVFDRHGLCKALCEKYFSKPSIWLKEDLYLDRAICRKIKLAPVKIPAGNYPIIHKGLRSFIVFEQAGKNNSTNPVKN